MHSKLARNARQTGITPPIVVKIIVGRAADCFADPYSGGVVFIACLPAVIDRAELLLSHG